MGAAAQILQPPKARLQALLAGVQELEAKVLQAKPIQTIRVARCGHEECGAHPDSVIGVDALVIEMGCSHAVPEIHEDTEESIDEARHHEVSFITCTCTPVNIHVHVPL